MQIKEKKVRWKEKEERRQKTMIKKNKRENGNSCRKKAAKSVENRIDCEL